MHDIERPNFQNETDAATAAIHAELLKLLQDARHRADDAGLDLVSIRISEAIDLLPVSMRKTG